MLATFVIELILLSIVLVRYGLKIPRTRLVAATLLCLAVFQLAEYNVCGGLGLHPSEWSRLGFICITLLPALGLHLVVAISGHLFKKLVVLAYATAAAWVGVFGLTEWAFRAYECAGNYAIFQMRSPYDTIYITYYFVWLFVAIAIAMYFMGRVAKPRHRALEFMVIGYLLFIGPTAIVLSVRPETIAGLPSIMCGFAIAYALIVAFGVARLEKKIATSKSDIRRVKSRSKHAKKR